MLDTEHGGMNEVLADLYADTGDKRWLELSYRFEHHAFTDPLKRHQDNLAGKHGNCQIPKLIGSAARYGYTGDRGRHHRGVVLLGSRRAASQLRDRRPRARRILRAAGSAERARRRPHVRVVQRLQHAEAHAPAVLAPARRDLRRLPRARAVQSRPRVDRSRGRRDVVHGAGRPRRAAGISGHAAELHLLRGHRHGEPRAARLRRVLRVGRHALGEYVRAVDGAVHDGRREAHDGDGLPRRRQREDDARRCPRRRSSRSRCAGRCGPATGSRSR